MLRFRVQQVHVPCLRRYFLPLPKLGEAQMRTLTAHLEGRGFRVRPGAVATRVTASRESQRISVDGRLGLASSDADVLDAVAPSIPSLFASGEVARSRPDVDASGFYFAVKRSGAVAQLQFFPRLESLRTWTCLRRDGLCGLTPDEAVALGWALRDAQSTVVECVTSRPTEASSPVQLGRNVFYRSKVHVSTFLSQLRDITSGGEEPACYLPRGSVIEVRGAKLERRLPAGELGEWCLAC